MSLDDQVAAIDAKRQAVREYMAHVWGRPAPEFEATIAKAFPYVVVPEVPRVEDPHGGSHA